MFHGKTTGGGIALHASALEAVHVPGGKADALKDAQVARLPLPADVYDNGLVKDVDRFASQLQQLFRQYGWPRQRVTLALPSAVTVIRPLMAPNLKKPKLGTVIQYQLGKAIALPFSNAVFDIAYLPDTLEVVSERIVHGKHTQTVPVLLVAAAGELIQGLQHAFQQADLGLSVVEVKGVSILRALRALHQQPMRPTIMLEFGVDRVEVHYFQAGALLFTRTLDVTPEKYGGSEGDWMSLEKQETSDGLERMFDHLIQQVERLMTFFQHMLHPHQREEIRALWVTGVVPEPERFQYFLRHRLENLEIRHISFPVFCLTSQETASRKCSLSAIGTALSGGTEDAD